ncbi:MAG: nuclear transport factor 2 family protein [Cyclobacteriaceae bacterium]|nr:nuclear transport factor 2 family protein [Cyclobacteriaceae bacterium]
MDYQFLITKFYTAFQNRDWQTMNRCYHPQATFSDPAFRQLTGKEVQAMWHMLCLNARDFTLTFSEVQVNKDSGNCHWQASYSFSKTGRKVHNKINAYFTFKEGQIYHHQDSFDLWRWSRMALGLPGVLLGWTPFLQNKIHATARHSLTKFINEHPEYQ